MCGRFNLTRPDEVVARFGFMDWTDKRPAPRFNIAPSQEVLIVVADPHGAPVARLARWGWQPAWHAGRRGTRPPPINARAETLLTSPLFRAALLGTRCLIPATGFFEWRVLGPGQRQAMHIQRADGGVFAFAGLWLPAAGDGGLPSAAIVTTRPNDLLAGIHTRMPAILRPEDEAAWLDATLDDAAALLGTLDPYPSELLHAYPVSARVNAWAHDDPGLLAPAEPLQQLLWPAE